jgi:tetratricopeptide (TPR) repeat protein
MDIMKRMAAIYGIKGDIRNGLQTANQMKLIAPSEYVGYKVAFKLLIQAKRFDIAAKELEIARKYSKPSMDYYFDVMTLELQQYQEDKSRAHFDKALSAIDIAVKSLKPKVKELIDAYIYAAEINLQLEKADQAVACLNAAQNPIDSFNNHFEVIETEYSPVELSEYDVEEMIEADRVKIADELGDYGLEELAEKIEPDEDGNREYFTEIPKKPEESLPEIKLEKTDVKFSSDDMDKVNRLFVGAYTLMKDYEKVNEYAKRLQASRSLQHAYIGRYVEANAMKALGSPEAKKKYLENIMFFRNAMIKDPSDMSAVSFRIQSCIDIGEFDEAERLCSLLTKAIREPMLKKIEDAKLGGE